MCRAERLRNSRLWILEAASHSSGEEYFQAFVRYLARAVDARCAFVAEFASPEIHTKARTIAFWAGDHIADNFEWTLAGTPCEEVLRGNLCHHPWGVREKFPEDRTSAERGIESYLGVPLLGLHPNTLRSRMKKLGIVRAQHEASMRSAVLGAGNSEGNR
jgi:hypothetical protein